MKEKNNKGHKLDELGNINSKKKDCRGMDFRHLHAFNLSMLRKQG